MKLIYVISYLRGEFDGKTETKQMPAPMTNRELMDWQISTMQKYIAGEIDFIIDSWNLSNPEDLRSSFWTGIIG